MPRSALLARFAALAAATALCLAACAPDPPDAPESASSPVVALSGPEIISALLPPPESGIDWAELGPAIFERWEAAATYAAAWHEARWYEAVAAAEAERARRAAAERAAAAAARPPAPPPAPSSSGGMPAILLRIAGCESGSGPSSFGSYTARNPRSSASGRWQFIDSTWRAWGDSRWARAYLAPPAVQDAAALRLYRASGTSPWNASRHCWG